MISQISQLAANWRLTIPRRPIHPPLTLKIYLFRNKFLSMYVCKTFTPLIVVQHEQQKELEKRTDAED